MAICATACKPSADGTKSIPNNPWATGRNKRLNGCGMVRAGRGRFIGLARWLERVSAKAEGEELAWLEERLDDAPCPSCDGARLRPESLAVELGGASIAVVGECAVVAATEWLNNLDFPADYSPRRRGHSAARSAAD